MPQTAPVGPGKGFGQIGLPMDNFMQYKWQYQVTKGDQVMTRIQRAAQVLDECMQVQISDFRLRLRLYSNDLLGLDAVRAIMEEHGSQAKGSRRRGGKRYLLYSREEDIKYLLEICAPLMTERQVLALACLEFLRANTANGLLAAAYKVLEVQ